MRRSLWRFLMPWHRAEQFRLPGTKDASQAGQYCAVSKPPPPGLPQSKVMPMFTHEDATLRISGICIRSPNQPRQVKTELEPDVRTEALVHPQQEVSVFHLLKTCSALRMAGGEGGAAPPQRREGEGSPEGQAPGAASQPSSCSPLSHIAPSTSRPVSCVPVPSDLSPGDARSRSPTLISAPGSQASFPPKAPTISGDHHVPTGGPPKTAPPAPRPLSSLVALTSPGA